MMEIIEAAQLSQPPICSLWAAIQKYPGGRWREALSQGQILSKLWLTGELKKHLSAEIEVVYIMAGWYGILPWLWSQGDLSFKKIRSFDMDPKCEVIADSVNKSLLINDWGFKACTMNIHDLNISNPEFEVSRANGTRVTLQDVPQLIVNTSCEHMVDFTEWFASIPQGMMLVLQTNNFFSSPEHINCKSRLRDFKKDLLMSEILYEGELKFKQYSRYMIIGVK